MDSLILCKNIFSERLNKRREKKKQLMGAALGRLLGRDDLSFLLDSTQGKSNDNAVFVVRRVAEFFHMDVSQFVLPSDIIKQLKGINLLKRLAGKGGIQLRKVKLSADGTRRTAVFYWLKEKAYGRRLFPPNQENIICIRKNFLKEKQLIL